MFLIGTISAEKFSSELLYVYLGIQCQVNNKKWKTCEEASFGHIFTKLPGVG